MARKKAPYHFSADPDVVASFEADENAESTLVRLMECTPIGLEWIPLTVQLDASSGPLGDFSNFVGCGTIPIFSDNAWEALRPLIENEVEALPIGVFQGSMYRVINVLSCPDVLDIEQSTVRMIGEYISDVRKYVFKPGALQGLGIFHLPRRRYLKPLVTQEFVDIVKKHKLNGGYITPVPQ